MINMDVMRAELIRDEGLRLDKRGRSMPYIDTVGKTTIGVGRNLSVNGISREEALYLLDHDIDNAIMECEKLQCWLAVAGDPVRARVLVNMMFNMGPKTFFQFVNTQKAIAEKRWADAAAGMRASQWAKQVGDRDERLAVMMETGEV